MHREPAVRSAYPFFQRFTSRWRDNDVYGHMNNAVYYEYVDAVVNLWLIEHGRLPVPRGEVVCIVAESGCTFHASLGFPGAIDAGLRADRIGRSAITYNIGLFAEGAARAAAEARFVHVCVDRVTMRPVPIPEDLRDALVAIRA